MKAQSLFVCLVFCAAKSAISLAADVDYTKDGPCTYKKLIYTPQIMPSSTGCRGKACLVKVTVTLPSTPEQSAGCPQGPYPIIVFFNAFQTFSISYKAYASRLASYGYAVVQYDTAIGAIIVDKVELTFMPAVLQQLQSMASNANHTLHGQLDLNMVAVAGHSRGGKLAALQYASNPAIKTSYLIDPVDNTVFSPESDAYPSAVKALQQQDPRKIAGVTGAGITSLCNPEGSNYSKFYDALGPGSWFVVLPQATHLALAETPLAATHICGKGTTTPLAGVPVTVATVTAWMEATVRGKPASAAFQAWVDATEQQGFLKFTVKA